MDITKFLANAQSGAAVSSASSEEETVEKSSRMGLHKRRSMKISGGVKDGRALRAIQNDEHRKSVRDQKLLGRRQISEDEQEAFDENEENDDQEEVPRPQPPAKKPTVNDRREKLKIFLAQKEKLEKEKRKNQKAAFRPSGKVHHEDHKLQGAMKPNIYNWGSNAANASTLSRNNSTLPRNVSTMSRNTSTLSRNTSTLAGSRSGTSSMLANKSTLTRSRPVAAPARAEATRPKAAPRPRTTASEMRETRTRRNKAAVSPKKLVAAESTKPEENKVEPPAIHVEPPNKSSSSSKSSTGSTSFAPQNFQFTMNPRLSMNIRVASSSSSSSSSEGSTRASIARASSTPKMATPKVVRVSSTPKMATPAFPPCSTPVQTKSTKKRVPLSNKKIIPLVSEIHKSTEDRLESVGDDSVFTETQDDSSTLDMSEIDKEIANSAMKNREAKKIERCQVIPFFPLNDGRCDSGSSQDEVETVANIEPEKEKNSDANKDSPIEATVTESDQEQKHEETKDVASKQQDGKNEFRGRTTRRSRRMSGVQPDPSLTQDDLSKTPAKRAKERSRSSDRRSKVGQCLLCTDHSGEHDHSDNDSKTSGGTTSKMNMTPMKTPRVSRKSTLPVLSETSPSQEEEKSAEKTGTRRRARNKSTNIAGPVEVQDQKTDTDEEVVDREEDRKKRRSKSRRSKSSAEVSKNPEKAEENAMEVDEDKDDKPMTRRSMRLTPAPKTIADETPTPLRSARRRGKAIENLAKNFENATLASAKKNIENFATPTFKNAVKRTEQVETPVEFKTPILPMPRSIVKTSQSASKLSPLLNKSPWIDFGRRSSGKKRKSLSEQKPRKSDLSSMFDDIPDDSSSPIHEILSRKAKSAEDLDIDVEAELQPNPAKQMRLDAQFDSIAAEQEIIAKANNTISETVPMKKAEVVHLGNVVCTAELHFGHFRKEYEKESRRIDSVCSEWEKKLEEIEGASEEVLGQIRSVIGQGRIMIARKGRFKQFATLVENCEFQLGEQKTTCMDLQGFWDMVYFQVEDVDRKFENLRKLEANNWIEPVAENLAKKRPPLRKPIKKPSAPVTKTGSGSSSSPSTKPKMSKIQQMMAARRAALAAKKEAPEIKVKTPSVATDDVETVEEEKTFDAGFFAIKSPIRKSPVSARTPQSGDCSPQKTDKSKSRERDVSGGDKLRRAVLTESARRLSGFSPMVSAMAKRSMSRESVGENGSAQTSPVKDSRRSSLFDDLEDDDDDDKKENIVEEDVTRAAVTIDPVAPLSSPVTKTYGKQVGSPAQRQRQIDAFDALVTSGGKDKEKAVDAFDALDKDKETVSEVTGLDGKYFMPGTPGESVSGSTGSTPVTATGHKWSTSSEEVARSESNKTDTSPDLKKSNKRVSLLPGMDRLSPAAATSGEVDMMNFDSPAPPALNNLTPRRSSRKSRI